MLRRGRAYFATDLRFRPELPSPDFVKWGGQVLARIKKVLTRPEIAPWIYMSTNAFRWICEEGANETGGAVEFQVPMDQ